MTIFSSPTFGHWPCYPRGRRIDRPAGKEGLSRVTDIALRPMLFAVMFVVSPGLYHLSSDMLIILTSEAFGTNKNTPHGRDVFSLPGVLGSYLAYTLVLGQTIHFSFEILPTGAWAIRVFRIKSRDARESRERWSGRQKVSSGMRCNNFQTNPLITERLP